MVKVHWNIEDSANVGFKEGNKMNNVNSVKKSKQLISSGVFIALYFLVFIIIGVICMPIPPLYLAMMSLIALVAAPVYMMLLEKAPLHGPIFIAAILPCLFLMLQGNIWIVIVTGVVSGILAEITAGMGKFRNKKLNLLSYVFFTQNLLGGFLPIWMMRAYFFQDVLERGMSTEFVDNLKVITPLWVLALVIIGAVICSVIGIVVSKKIFKKHFEKAGIV